MQQSQDVKLIAKAKRGDKKAYSELVKLYSRYVYAVCLGVLGNTHQAEDAAQEVLIKAFKELKNLKDLGQFKGWLARIARNECVDQMREMGKMRQALEKKQDKDKSSGDYREIEVVRDAISELEEKYRTPLMLYYFQGNDTNKVAQIMNSDGSTIRTRLSRARKLLRDILSRKEAENA